MSSTSDGDHRQELTLYLRGRRYWVRGTVRGQFIREPTGTSDPVQARTYRATRQAELYEESIFGARAVVTFERAARAYLEFEPRSRRRIERVERLIAFFGTQIHIAKIDQTEADRAVSKIVGKDAAPATKIAEVYGPLSTINRFSAKREWCPLRLFDKPSVPKSDPSWLTPRQAAALEAAAAPHLKPLIRFLFCTGARLSEALDLDWKDVDLDAEKAIFRDTKAERLSESAKPRVVLLPPAAVVALLSLPHRDGKVFRRDDGEPYADRNREQGGQIGTAWATACREAGLPGEFRQQKRRYVWTPSTRRQTARYSSEPGVAKSSVKTVKVFVPEHTPHSARHSYATWAYALTKSTKLVQDDVGWSGSDLVDRYAHLMRDELVPDISLVWGDRHPRFGVIPAPAQPTVARTISAHRLALVSKSQGRQ